MTEYTVFLDGGAGYRVKRQGWLGWLEVTYGYGRVATVPFWWMALLAMKLHRRHWRRELERS